MKKYAFNGYLFSQRQTGVMRYAKELLLALDVMCKKGEFCLVIPNCAENIPVLCNIDVVKIGNIKGNLWEQISFPIYCKKKSFVPVNFNNTCPLIYPGIIAIHDIAYKLHPEFGSSLHGKISNLYHKIIFKLVSYLKTPIITVSHFSKYSLIDVYKINPRRIHIIQNSYNHFEKIKCDYSILEKLQICEYDYYFSLGSISRMKNTRWIVEVAKRNPEQVFIISGARSSNENNDYVSENIHNIIFTGYISDEEIKALMSKCKAFIYPSIYDGFGIPPMEALSVGARVICSNAACLPEIYQGSVNYIDPYDYNVNLNELLLEPVADPDLILKKYSWAKSASKLYEMLKID